MSIAQHTAALAGGAGPLHCPRCGGDSIEMVVRRCASYDAVRLSATGALVLKGRGELIAEEIDQSLLCRDCRQEFDNPSQTWRIGRGRERSAT